MASIEHTNFWMQPAVQSSASYAVDGPTKLDREKKLAQTGRPAGQVTFLVDFFEHCQQSNDIEFGGNDVLQAQVKHRLNTTGIYIASTKDSVEQAAMANVHNDVPAQPANALEALLAGGGGNLQALLNIPDADDETMVQLATALSLQDQAGAGSGAMNLGGQLQVTGGNLEAFPLSDTTASLPSSDDEAGDMAVNVGSMLHTSLADRNGSGPGSDSGGSQIDSVSDKAVHRVT